jgi:ribosomal protein S6E (S10)
MDDLNDPRISAYKPQRRLLLPAPPGYRPKRSKARRKQKALAEARIARLHLVGLTDAAVIIMGCLLAAAVVLVVVLVLVRISHH